ncbi:unnamed protein product [Anisakis simplex]|uniref:Alpha-1,3-glucosyltransferase n=1 Tax=Anisakis simplex TaxID=6269 RepID=A0A0M3KCL7_ANISI|nr:unnamed protein product [Anisakis simplex]
MAQQKLKKSAQTEPSREWNIFRTWSFWISSSFILTLKTLVVPMYHSTDFEVHRNWMAITHNLPMKVWYYENTSEWTLDYPPLFAYFELLLGMVSVFQVANRVVPSALIIQKEAYFSKELLYFHRFSVIVCDLFYIISCGFLANTMHSIRFKGDRSKHCAMGLFLLLIANITLILIDNIHFQYNSLLTTVLLLSISLALQERFLLAAFMYCILLNMKHIYLYYAFAYVLIYSFAYLLKTLDRSVISRCAKLAFSMCIPFLVSFGQFSVILLVGVFFVIMRQIWIRKLITLGPFLWLGGIELCSQIISRLFPFQRGLTHAYWAPNLWALYNFIDLILYNLLKRFSKLSPAINPPLYTSGLVQEYPHSVLPSINAHITLVVILCLLSPSICILMKQRRRFRDPNTFILLLTHSAFAFFLAGYHVHEKAVLLITIPYTILAVLDHRFLPSFIVLSTIANISIFPLFFTPFESILKVTLMIFYHLFAICVANYCCKVKAAASSMMNIWQKLYLVFVFVIQCYCLLLHNLILGSRFEYIPLMLTSVSVAIGIVFVFVDFLWKGYCSIDPSLHCKCLTFKEKMKSS